VAFLDINPVSRGHALVVPRINAQHLADLDDGLHAHLWRVARSVGAAQQSGLGSLAQHFVVNDGRAASQSVPHVHVHVIPRYRGDRLRTVTRMIWHVSTLMVPRPETAGRRRELDRVAGLIADAMPGHA